MTPPRPDLGLDDENPHGGRLNTRERRRVDPRRNADILDRAGLELRVDPVEPVVDRGRYGTGCALAVMLGSVVLAAALAGGLIAASREAADPTTEATRDVSGLRDGASGPPLLGAPSGGGVPSPAGEIGTALVGGTASHVGRQFGRAYLALPEHRWGRRGLLVEICGDGGCVIRRSTDAGPDLAMQRAGRVADLNAWDFEAVCGCPASTGLTDVTVEYLGEIDLPATDVAP
jgi:hypothetical protein